MPCMNIWFYARGTWRNGKQSNNFPQFGGFKWIYRMRKNEPRRKLGRKIRERVRNRQKPWTSYWISHQEVLGGLNVLGSNPLHVNLPLFWKNVLRGVDLTAESGYGRGPSFNPTRYATTHHAACNLRTLWRGCWCLSAKVRSDQSAPDTWAAKTGTGKRRKPGNQEEWHCHGWCIAGKNHVERRNYPSQWHVVWHNNKQTYLIATYII